jgi:hypothetical protein
MIVAIARAFRLAPSVVWGMDLHDFDEAVRSIIDTPPLDSTVYAFAGGKKGKKRG